MSNNYLQDNPLSGSIPLILNNATLNPKRSAYEPLNEVIEQIFSEILNDDMTILISKEKGIKVEEEKSPQKICSKQGWVSRVDVPVVCLPNSVYVIISDINEVDFDIGLQ